jgi:hypothetical protein
MFGKPKSEIDNSLKFKFEEDIRALSLENVKLKERLDDAEASLEAFGIEKQKLASELLASEDAHKVEIETLSNSITKKVNMTLASIGVDVFATENFSVDHNLTDRDALNTFKSLEGNAKTEYYKQNKDKITRALLSGNLK